MVRETSKILETNTSKKELSKIKTHKEILDLLKEIDLIEEKIKNIEECDETSNKRSFSEKNPNDSIVFGESFEEIQFIEIPNETIENKGTNDTIEGEIEFIEVPTNSELIERVRQQEKEDEFYKNKKQKFGKKKLRFRVRRRKPIELSKPLKEFYTPKKSNKNVIPKNSTFTIRINNDGNLVGLNIKKPKIKRKRFHFLKKEINKESSSEEIEDKINIVKKITKKLSGIRLKTIKGEGSRVSNTIAKIKGIFSRS